MRLLVVISHPIQYYAPWFQQLAQADWLDLKVLYLLSGPEVNWDTGFGRNITWDIDLISDYAHRFILNTSSHPNSASFGGLKNPSIIREVLTESPDAILLFGYNYWTHLRILLSPRLRHIPLLLRGDSHLLATDNQRQWRQYTKKILRRLIFRRIDLFLPVGRANFAYFLANGMRVSQGILCPHCVDNKRFMQTAEQAIQQAKSWRKTLSIPDDHLVYLFAGKLINKKCPLDLIEAFRLANPPKASLLLVGDGPLESAAKSAAGKDKRIVFVPFQNQSQMPRTYAAGDIYVLPSTSKTQGLTSTSETWGLAVNEAFCLARPALVSSHVGCGPDLIREGETGWTFPAGNVDELAARLTLISRKREQLPAMGQKANDHISRFDYTHATAALRVALQRLMRSR